MVILRTCTFVWRCHSRQRSLAELGTNAIQSGVHNDSLSPTFHILESSCLHLVGRQCAWQGEMKCRARHLSSLPLSLSAFRKGKQTSGVPAHHRQAKCPPRCDILSSLLCAGHRPPSRCLSTSARSLPVFHLPGS